MVWLELGLACPWLGLGLDSACPWLGSDLVWHGTKISNGLIAIFSLSGLRSYGGSQFEAGLWVSYKREQLVLEFRLLRHSVNTFLLILTLLVVAAFISVS